MSTEDEPRPRRALPPEGDDGATWAPTSSPSDSSGTLIPPPAVMPNSEVPPVTAGRRFSAEDVPDEDDRPLPRRSALSPNATRARSPQTPDAAPAASTPAASRAVVEDAPERGGSSKLRYGILAALLVAALAVAAFFLVPRGEGGPAPTPTPSIDPVATYLLQPNDLDNYSGKAWTVASTATTVDATTPQPLCVLTSGETAPAASATLVRTFAAAFDAPGALLHQVDTYANDEDATAAYAARLAQLGECPRTTGFVTGATEIKGLSDAGTAIKLVVQDAQSQYHTILLSRTGRHVNVVDATQPDQPADAGPLAKAVQPAAKRQCDGGGTCPSTVEANVTVPPAVQPLGWLASVDLPRITAGQGVWRGTPEVLTTVKSKGTRCEAVDLAAAPGASSSQQRTYLLQDDTNAPATFGLDEMVYTFDTPEKANGFVGTLTTNIDSCATRAATATVAKQGDVSGVGTGAMWVVTQKLNAGDASARFRTSAVAVGNKVLYLMANPGEKFDFSDEAWANVTRRAAERLSQKP